MAKEISDEFYRAVAMLVMWHDNTHPRHPEIVNHMLEGLTTFLTVAAGVRETEKQLLNAVIEEYRKDEYDRKENPCPSPEGTGLLPDK